MFKITGIAAIIFNVWLFYCILSYILPLEELGGKIEEDTIESFQELQF